MGVLDGTHHEPVLEQTDDLHRDLLERLPHRGQPRRHDLRGQRVVEAHHGDVVRTGLAAAFVDRLQNPHGDGVAAAHESRRLVGVEHGVRGAAPELDGVLAPRAEPGGGQAALVHAVDPPAAPVLSDVRRLLPAHPRDALVSPVGEVVDGEHDPRATVDVDPRVGGAGLLPGAAEGHERHLPLLEPLRLRVAAVGVGDEEGVDGRRAQEGVVPVERVAHVLGGEQQDVQAGLLAGLDQRVQEPVHEAGGGALHGGLEAQPHEVGGPGAEIASRAVGRVAQRLDRALHALQGVGAQQVGAVQGVRDGLA